MLTAVTILVDYDRMFHAYVEKKAVVIDMHIQFIANLAVLFGVQFRIIKKKTHL